MHKDKYVFAQLVEFLDNFKFRRIVAKYDGVYIHCYYADIRNAFLFSCFTGLRFSDIKALTWGKVRRDSSGDTFISFTQKKTGKWENLPVNRERYEHPSRILRPRNDRRPRVPVPVVASRQVSAVGHRTGDRLYSGSGRAVFTLLSADPEKIIIFGFGLLEKADVL